MFQHPIPQNITTYQFRLIGDMTIKQFVYLSVGIGFAILFYYTIGFEPFKYLFTISSAVCGFALAFLPLEERPLDQWVINYFKAILSPTQFIYKKSTTPPDYLTYTASKYSNPADTEIFAKQALARRQQGLESFLTTLPNDQKNDLDLAILKNSQNYLDLFNASPTTQTLSPPSPETTLIYPPPPPSLPPATVAAQTAQNLPFPSTPSSPNTVVGMVLDRDEKIVNNAIVEIIDENGFPVRATKTNALGQFFSTTPLKKGLYRLSIDKNNLTFDTIELNLTGQIVPPLKIVAQ